MKNIKRYILAACCGLGIVFMLGFGINAMDVKADPFVSVRRNYTNESRNTALNTLIQDYYDAYDEGNLLALNKVAYPFSDSEISYIELMSKNIDSREIRDIYSKKGIDKGSYFVSVVNDINFSGMDKSALGLDFFYVETDEEDGSLYINNLYSTYNLNNSENQVDPYVTSLIEEFEQQPDVLRLQARVQTEFNDAMENDQALKTFFDETLQTEVSDWAKAYHQKTLDQKAEEERKAKEEAEAKKAAEEAEKKAAEEKAKADAEAQAAAQAAEQAAAQQAAEQAAAQAAQQNASSGSFVNFKTINVRAAADTASQNIGRLECGTVLTKIRDEGNGEWTVISLNGREGFIRSEFVTTISNQTPRDITLTRTVNVRDEMSENGQKVAVAQMGTAVKVECDYANGWSRVSYGNNIRGYAKTEYLG